MSYNPVIHISMLLQWTILSRSHHDNSAPLWAHVHQVGRPAMQQNKLHSDDEKYDDKREPMREGVSLRPFRPLLFNYNSIAQHRIE